MALQRLLKAAGTFGFQAIKKGKILYAAYLCPALTRAGKIMAGYPEFNRRRERLLEYRAAAESAVKRTRLGSRDRMPG